MELNHQSEKYTENVNQQNIILRYPKNNCPAHLFTTVKAKYSASN